MRRCLGRMLVVAAILTMMGCGGSEGGSMLSSDEWSKARQQAIDLVTEIAHGTSTKAVSVGESIGACETGDDLDRSIGQARYQVNAQPDSDAREYLDQQARPRLKGQGWTFRDRSDEPNNLGGTTLDYLWTKGDANLDVTINKSPGEQDLILIRAVSPCGTRGEIRSGIVEKDDPWFLAPTVEGPTVEDIDPDRSTTADD